MQTPKVGGRYKRHADGTVVPADHVTATPAPQPQPQTPVPAEPLAEDPPATDSNPEEGE